MHPGTACTACSLLPASALPQVCHVSLVLYFTPLTPPHSLTLVKHLEMPERESSALLLPCATVLATGGQHTGTSLLAPFPERESSALLLPCAAVLATGGQHTGTSLLTPFPGHHGWETVHALEGVQPGYEQP